MASVIGGQLAGMAVAGLTEICYARLLGPAPRGQISLCMMAIALGALIGGLGGDLPIVIWTADRKRKPSEWLPALFVWGLAGSAIACALWALLYWRARLASFHGITSPLAVIILVTIPFSIFFSYLIAFLTGAERFRFRSIVAFIEGASGLLIFLLFILRLGRNAETAMLGNLAGLLLGVAITAVALKDFFRSAWARPALNENVRAGLWTGLRGHLGNCAAFFNYRLDVFIMNYFLEPAQIGVYAVGVVISEVLWQIPQAVAVSLFPRTARTLKEGATEFTCLIMRQVLLITSLSGLALAALSPFAVPLVFGARFAESSSVILWILPGTIALSLAKVASADLAARSKTGYSTLAGLVAFGVTVGLDLLLIPRMGIRGAALASSAAYLVNTVLLVTALRHELKVSWGSLLIPTRMELLRYKQLWLRFFPEPRVKTAL